MKHIFKWYFSFKLQAFRVYMFYQTVTVLLKNSFEIFPWKLIFRLYDDLFQEITSFKNWKKNAQASFCSCCLNELIPLSSSSRPHKFHTTSKRHLKRKKKKICIWTFSLVENPHKIMLKQCSPNYSVFPDG